MPPPCSRPGPRQGKAPPGKFWVPVAAKPRKSFLSRQASPKVAPARATTAAAGGPIIDRYLILSALVLTALVLADLTLQGGTGLLFLSRELADLVDKLAFWR